MYSLWEKQSFLTSDILIVGAGITGLSAAATFKELDPSLNIRVLEQGILPTGASTKNAGFACFGSVSELINDVKTIGEEGMVNLVMKRWDGLQKTCQRLGRSAIDLQVKNGYELLFDSSTVITDEMDHINTLLHPFFGEKVFELSNHKIKDFGFGNTHQLVANTFEGQLDTGKLIDTLWKYCTHLGVSIHTGCKVDHYEESHNHVEVHAGDYVFDSKKLAICTNAFTKKLLKDEQLDILPGRGIVMSVIPDKTLSFEGTFHYDEGYYYFRDYYGKLLFGGGRNLALQEEETEAFGINERIKDKLIRDIEEIILPNQHYEIEMIWSGIMAFGENKAPIVRKVTDRIAMGVRLGGMGVAIGSLVGEEVAQLLIES